MALPRSTAIHGIFPSRSRQPHHDKIVPFVWRHREKQWYSVRDAGGMCVVPHERPHLVRPLYLTSNGAGSCSQTPRNWAQRLHVLELGEIAAHVRGLARGRILVRATQSSIDYARVRLLTSFRPWSFVVTPRDVVDVTTNLLLFADVLVFERNLGEWQNQRQCSREALALLLEQSRP